MRTVCLHLLAIVAAVLALAGSVAAQEKRSGILNTLDVTLSRDRPLPSPLSLADVIRIAGERRDEIEAARAVGTGVELHGTARDFPGGGTERFASRGVPPACG